MPKRATFLTVIYFIKLSSKWNTLIINWSSQIKYQHNINWRIWTNVRCVEQLLIDCLMMWNSVAYKLSCSLSNEEKRESLSTLNLKRHTHKIRRAIMFLMFFLSASLAFLFGTFIERLLFCCFLLCFVRLSVLLLPFATAIKTIHLILALDSCAHTNKY